MTIRPAKPADAARMIEIEQASPTAAHWRVEDYSAMLAGTGAKRVVLVAEERGRVLGFVIALVATDEWEIENIVVAPDARRRRLASRMLSRLMDVATERDAISMLLEVRESNAAARSFYVNAGFAESGRRTRYYTNPDEDAVLYRITLR